MCSEHARGCKQLESELKEWIKKNEKENPFWCKDVMATSYDAVSMLDFAQSLRRCRRRWVRFQVKPSGMNFTHWDIHET